MSNANSPEIHPEVNAILLSAFRDAAALTQGKVSQTEQEIHALEGNGLPAFTNIEEYQEEVDALHKAFNRYLDYRELTESVLQRGNQFLDSRAGTLASIGTLLGVTATAAQVAITGESSMDHANNSTYAQYMNAAPVSTSLVSAMGAGVAAIGLHKSIDAGYCAYHRFQDARARVDQGASPRDEKLAGRMTPEERDRYTNVIRDTHRILSDQDFGQVRKFIDTFNDGVSALIDRHQVMSPDTINVFLSKMEESFDHAREIAFTHQPEQSAVAHLRDGQARETAPQTTSPGVQGPSF